MAGYVSLLGRLVQNLVTRVGEDLADCAAVCRRGLVYKLRSFRRYDDVGPGGVQDYQLEPEQLAVLVESVQNKPWFCQLDRKAAQDLVHSGGPGCFVVRPSASTRSLTLTLWYHHRAYNILIRQREDGLLALGSKKNQEVTFRSVEEMVRHYERESLILYSGGELTGRTRLRAPPPGLVGGRASVGSCDGRRSSGGSDQSRRPSAVPPGSKALFSSGGGRRTELSSSKAGRPMVQGGKRTELSTSEANLSKEMVVQGGIRTELSSSKVGRPTVQGGKRTELSSSEADLSKEMVVEGGIRTELSSSKVGRPTIQGGKKTELSTSEADLYKEMVVQGGMRTELSSSKVGCPTVQGCKRTEISTSEADLTKEMVVQDGIRTELSSSKVNRSIGIVQGNKRTETSLEADLSTYMLVKGDKRTISTSEGEHSKSIVQEDKRTELSFPELDRFKGITVQEGFTTNSASDRKGVKDFKPLCLQSLSGNCETPFDSSVGQGEKLSSEEDNFSSGVLDHDCYKTNSGSDEESVKCPGQPEVPSRVSLKENTHTTLSKLNNPHVPRSPKMSLPGRAVPSLSLCVSNEQNFINTCL